MVESGCLRRAMLATDARAGFPTDLAQKRSSCWIVCTSASRKIWRCSPRHWSKSEFSRGHNSLVHQAALKFEYTEAPNQSSRVSVERTANHLSYRACGRKHLPLHSSQLIDECLPVATTRASNLSRSVSVASSNTCVNSLKSGARTTLTLSRLGRFELIMGIRLMKPFRSH